MSSEEEKIEKLKTAETSETEIMLTLKSKDMTQYEIPLSFALKSSLIENIWKGGLLTKQ